MCLSEFVTTYKLTQYIPKIEKCLPRYFIDVKGTTKVIMQRSKSACLRCQVPNILLDKEAHYYSLLYLFLPFYSEEEIFLPYHTYQDAFASKKTFVTPGSIKDNKPCT